MTIKKKDHEHGLLMSHMTLLLSSEADPLEDAAIFVLNGRVEAVGSAKELNLTYPNAQKLDLTGYLLIPGLINSHCHSPMGFFRGIAHRKSEQSSSESTMIENFFYPAEQSLTPDLIEPLAYGYLIDSLKSGITTTCDAYFFSDGMAKAMESLGVRGYIGEHIADLGGPIDSGFDVWNKVRRNIDSWSYSDRVKPMVYAHAADTVSIGLLSELASFSRSNNLPFHMHLSQSDGERQRVLKREKISPVAYAHKAKALNPNSILVHLVSATKDDFKMIADSGAYAGITPVSEMIYERLPPIEQISDLGVPVCLGTDGPASNDTADLFQELRVYALMMRDRKLSKSAFAPKKLLKMVWDNPSKVLGASDLGHLNVGAKADLVVLKNDLGVMPTDFLMENLIYSYSSRHVKHVMVDGRWALWDGDVCALSEKTIETAYESAVKAIWKKAGFI